MPAPFALGKPNIEHNKRAAYIITLLYATYFVVHVGVRTGIGHGQRNCVRGCNDQRFDNGKKRMRTRNEVRTAKGYDAPLGRIYPENRHTEKIK